MDPERASPTPLILLVEDDPFVREALTFALTIEGFEVEVHEAAETALERSDPRPPACLVFDYLLPGATGLDALEALRGHGLSCPAILITTQPKAAMRQRAEDLRAEILEKPLLGGELPAAIRRLIGA